MRAFSRRASVRGQRSPTKRGAGRELKTRGLLVRPHIAAKVDPWAGKVHRIRRTVGRLACGKWADRPCRQIDRKCAEPYGSAGRCPDGASWQNPLAPPRGTVVSECPPWRRRARHVARLDAARIGNADDDSSTIPRPRLGLPEARGSDLEPGNAGGNAGPTGPATRSGGPNC